MKKQIQLSKYNQKIQDGIIKLVPRAVAIVEEKKDMSKKQVTLELIYKELTEFKSEFKDFKQEMTDFKQETNEKFGIIDKKFDTLFSLPTIKKELAQS